MTFLLDNSIIVNSLIIFLFSFVTTYILIPRIIDVVNHKELMDKPNERSSHKQLTPTFGGISFFIVLIFTLYFVRVYDTSPIRLNVIASLTILLFTGLKDDLAIISNRTKIIAQASAIFVFLLETSFFQINLHGFLGIYQTNPILGYLLASFIMFAIINSFNLIDGIDGLASIMGIVVLTFFSIINYKLGNNFNLLICLALIASLSAFLRFNLSTKKKIFMGDTGSLILGFIISYMTISFLNVSANKITEIGLIPKNSILVVIALLIFPLFDMARVFIYRLLDKKHPLKPDRNHTHHLLISFGNSHIKSSIIIISLSILFSIFFVFLTTQTNNSFIIILSLLISFLAFYILVYSYFNKLKLKN